MKFRIFIVLALLVFAVALSSITAEVRISSSGLAPTDTGYLRVYYADQTPPPARAVRLPAPNTSVVYFIDVPDSWGQTAEVLADLRVGGRTYTLSSTAPRPVFHFRI